MTSFSTPNIDPELTSYWILSFSLLSGSAILMFYIPGGDNVRHKGTNIVIAEKKEAAFLWLIIDKVGPVVRFQLLRFLANLRFGALALSDWHVCQPRHLAILSHETIITIHIPYWRHYYQFVLDQNNARITDLEYNSNHSHHESGCR